MAGILQIFGLARALKVADAVLDYSTGIKDTRELHRKIGIRILRWVHDQFRTEGRQPGSRALWPPLKPSTIAGRRKQSSRILQDTGKLRASFTSKPTASEVRVGTPMQIALYHEFGTAGPYEIKPVRAKALRFVRAREVGFQEAALTGRRAGSIIREGKRLPTSAAGSRFGERFTLKQRAAGAVQSLFGRRVPTGQKTRFERFVFAKGVLHPGLPPRPMLPREEYAERLIRDVAAVHLRAQAEKAQLEVEAQGVRTPEPE